jgi:hypothetical protein
MRPVMRGMCKMEGLRDGTLDLCDVALMNETIDVSDENDNRMRNKNRG